jgi:hypothetical protein
MTLRQLLWAGALASALLVGALWATTPSCEGLTPSECYEVIQ